MLPALFPEKVLWLVGGTVRTREETVSEALVKEDTKCIGTSEGVLVFVLCIHENLEPRKI